MSVKLYGASDDLIELEGDIRDEFTAPNDEPATLGFSNGALLQITYDNNGVWRITPLNSGPHVSIDYAPADDDDNYSDVAVINGDVTWVVCGTDFVQKRK